MPTTVLSGPVIDNAAMGRPPASTMRFPGSPVASMPSTVTWSVAILGNKSASAITVGIPGAKTLSSN